MNSSVCLVTSIEISDPVNWNWKENCRFGEMVIDQKPSLKNDCFSLCVSNPNCTHFTWFDGSCYMQSGQIRKEEFQKPGFICGIVSNKPSIKLI